MEHLTLDNTRLFLWGRKITSFYPNWIISYFCGLLVVWQGNQWSQISDRDFFSRQILRIVFSISFLCQCQCQEPFNCQFHMAVSGAIQLLVSAEAFLLKLTKLIEDAWGPISKPEQRTAHFGWIQLSWRKEAMERHAEFRRRITKVTFSTSAEALLRDSLVMFALKLS